MARKILIIDDEPTLVEIIKSRLVASNYEVITAFDGLDGLQKVKSEKPDLIILDVLLPRLDGYQLLHKVREEKPPICDTPVIIISGRQKTKELFDEWEISGFIGKPFDGATLLSKIKDILAQVEKKESAGKKALIIGNDNSALEVIKTFLESRNFSVDTASAGPAGIEKAVMTHPNVIFIQSAMSGMGGMEACRILREMSSMKKTPFMVFGAKTLEFVLAEALESVETIEYSQPDDLIKEIDEYLGKHFSSSH